MEFCELVGEIHENREPIKKKRKGPWRAYHNGTLIGEFRTKREAVRERNAKNVEKNGLSIRANKPKRFDRKQKKK